MREPAVQRSPLSEKTPKIVALTAASRSASAKTTAGDLPPSSIDRPLSHGAALAKIVWPVFDSPVKEVSGTSGGLTRESQAKPSSPKPLTLLNTPARSPASSKMPGHGAAEGGVNAAGLSTAVSPVALGGAGCHASSMSGVFRGVMSPAPASGLRLT